MLAVVVPLVASARQLSGHVPRASSGLQTAGRFAGTNRLELGIGLSLRNQGALSNLLHRIYDPASADFHRFLTPEEFTERFGPTEAAVSAVAAFARAHGLEVRGTSANRMLVDVGGSAADVERAFGVRLLVYPHPSGSRDFFAPDVEPSVDDALPVLDVSGLSDFPEPRPMSRVQAADRPAGARPALGSGPSGAYGGGDFRAAYAPGVALDGSGQAVGLVQFDGYYAADITAYRNYYGLPSVTLSNVLLDGFSGTPTANANAVAEVSLDIEMVIAMSPGLSKLYVYEGNPNFPNFKPNDVLSRIANDNLVKQVSCSWGWTGGPSATTDQILQQMIAQGQSFFVASGDSDAFLFGNVDSSTNYGTPSASAYVTSVGGTTLSTTGPGGSWTSETTWNWNNDVGSSGGVSAYYSIPSWQQGVSMASNGGSSTQRNFPDVALTANNIHVIYNNGSVGTFGGTSCASPLWAGFLALVNQQAAANGLGPVGFLNPAIYPVGKGSAFTTNFHDITTGNNFNSSSPTQFVATAGYDLCTGWGTPRGSNLINTLAPPRVSISLAGAALAYEGCTPTNGLLDAGENVSARFALRNDGSMGTSNLIATLLATNGVAVPSGPIAYGPIPGSGGTATQTFSFVVAAECGGSVQAWLSLQDGAMNLGTVSVSFAVGQFVPVTALQEDFDAVSAPALPSGWTTTNSGAQAPWVTSAASADTAPNSAFTTAAAAAGDNELVSPVFAVSSPSARLVFRNNYNLQFVGNSARDGGVLEIKIGTNAFADILSAGGSFVSGGYNHTINSTRGNPLAGRSAWSGNSGGFITTIATLPANAAQQSVQFKWRCGSDNNGASTGWFIDSISVTESNLVCCSAGTADLAVSVTAAPSPVLAGDDVTYTIIVTNNGPSTATDAVLTDVLPPGAPLLSVSSSQGTFTNTDAAVVFSFGPILANGTATAQVVVAAPSNGAMTNIATATANESDPLPADNTVTILTAVAAPPQLAVSPPAYDFGQCFTGTVAHASFVVTNLGDVALSGTATIATGAFAIASGAMFTIAGHHATNIIVSFAPQAAGSFSNDTVFISNGGGSMNPVLGVAVILPVMPLVADRTVPEMTPLILTNAQLNADIPAGLLTYALLAPPAGMTIDTNTGVISWTPTEAQGPGTNTITTVVTESAASPLFATNSFSIVVSEVNVAPVIAAVSNRIVYPGQLLTITNAASDADLPANALSFSLVAAPAGAAIDATNGTISWTASSADAGSTNSVTVRVTDDGTPPMSAETSFEILVEMPPVFLGDIATGPVLSWPLGASAFVLEFATNLENLTAWIPVSNTPAISGGMLVVTNGPPRDAEFFRLRLP